MPIVYNNITFLINLSSHVYLLVYAFNGNYCLVAKDIFYYKDNK
jgi:hypothetical protein